jgi:hypothetical protein
VEVYGAAGGGRLLPSLPDSYSLHTVDLVDGEVVLCGGEDAYGGSSHSSSCLRLAASLAWQRHSTTLAPREGHSSQALLGALHLMGGFDPQLDWAVTSTERMAPAVGPEWTNGPDLMVESFLVCSVKTGPDTFVTTGGFYHKYHVVEYNFTAGTATRLADLLQPRSYHGCALVEEPGTGRRGLLVTGGYDYPPGTLADTELLDLATGQWSRRGDLTVARYAPPPPPPPPPQVRPEGGGAGGPDPGDGRDQQLP